MRSRLTQAAIVGVLVAIAAAPAALAAQPKTPAAVRHVMSRYVRYVLAGDSRACAVLDKHGRALFVRSARPFFKKAVRACPDAVAAWGALMRKIHFPLAAELKTISRARVTVRGRRATLVDSEDHAVFLYISGRWRLDRDS